MGRRRCSARPEPARARAEGARRWRGGPKPAVARARAAREEARRDLARLQTLQASGAVAVGDVDAARTRLGVGEAQVNIAFEQVQRARAALDRAQTGTLEVQIREEDVRAAGAQGDAARGPGGL